MIEVTIEPGGLGWAINQSILAQPADPKLVELFINSRNKLGDIEYLRRIILFRDWLTGFGINDTLKAWEASNDFVNQNEETILKPNIK